MHSNVIPTTAEILLGAFVKSKNSSAFDHKIKSADKYNEVIKHSSIICRRLRVRMTELLPQHVGKVIFNGMRIAVNANVVAGPSR